MSNQEFDEFENYEEKLEARRLRSLELKRKRKIRQRIILAVIAAVLILAVVLIVKSCSGPKKGKDPAPIDPPPEQNEIVAEPEEPDITATLAAVGDIMMYDDQLKDAQIDDTTYDFTNCFKAVKAYTQNANLTVGNLELNFLGYAPYGGNPRTAPYFNSPESLAATLKDIGFDILQTANTYSIMSGINGLQSTMNVLTQAGIEPLGTHATDPDKSGTGGVVVKDVNGIKFAFIGFTKGVNSMRLPPNNLYSVDLLYTDYDTEFKQVDTASIMKRIEAAKNQDPDVIVAMLHWGSEYDLEVSETMEDIRDLMFKSGVDVILGSHSHVVGPMEMMDVETTDGEMKQCFVAYSLGNFVSSMPNQFTHDSVILNLEFTKDGDTGDTTISNAEYTPLYILDRGEEAAESRFEVLPIRSAVKSSMFQEYETEMNAAIENLKQHTASDYDSGQ